MVEVNVKMGKNFREEKLSGNGWNVSELSGRYFFEYDPRHPGQRPMRSMWSGIHS